MITTTDHVSPTSASVVRAGQSARKRSKSLIVEHANRGGVSVRAARWTTERCSASSLGGTRSPARRRAALEGRVSGGVAAPEPVNRAAHCRPVRGRLERPEGGPELRGIRDEGPFELVQGLAQLS